MEHVFKGHHLSLERHGEKTKLPSMGRVKIMFADKLLTGNESSHHSSDFSISAQTDLNPEVES